MGLTDWVRRALGAESRVDELDAACRRLEQRCARLERDCERLRGVARAEMSMREVAEQRRVETLGELAEMEVLLAARGVDRHAAQPLARESDPSRNNQICPGSGSKQ